VRSDHTTLRRALWRQYVWHRQTISQLAKHYGRSPRWVQRQLDQAPITPRHEYPQPIIAVTDTTFFGRGYGVLVVRCPRLKRNVHIHEVNSETPLEYIRARQDLEASGYSVEAVVIDGKRGVLRVFHDLPVQFCQFHQMAIVRRYLTAHPQLVAGQELWAIVLTLPVTTEATFVSVLNLWHERWQIFLKERTYTPDSRHWSYTHRRLRSAFRSLRTNLPHLFTYQRYPNLHIPNTTNSLDGHFGQLKRLLNVHSGLTAQRRYRLILEIMNH
jgi:hypothetical protein